MEIQDIMDRGEEHWAREGALNALLGLTGPGGYALREPDGRLMVWACEEDAKDDDGQRATYRSAGPVTDREWTMVIRLTWINEYDKM